MMLSRRRVHERFQAFQKFFFGKRTPVQLGSSAESPFIGEGRRRRRPDRQGTQEFAIANQLERAGLWQFRRIRHVKHAARGSIRYQQFLFEDECRAVRVSKLHPDLQSKL